ncbi:uncharacterized protein LOC132244008 [Alligator mississippiensis]|uniref:uncharacterized protein LOC132244008 n=1 Tax=Alligator mississippiensis TaxID=8496 RepID=UPI0028778DF0|nr:uncharacterized protein LOC132244008 [Alligator mississippiensis]
MSGLLATARRAKKGPQTAPGPHMATRMGSRESTLELELVKNCPWRSGKRQVENFMELEAHIAYHQVGGTGERFISGRLSLKGEEGASEDGAQKEREVYLHPTAFGCIMSNERVLFRPLDTVSLARVNPAGEVNPTLTQECARCLRCARESEEPVPIDRFAPFMLASRLRGHELPSELREDLEMEERAADERVAPQYDKGGVLTATFRTVTDLMHKNLSLKAQLRMAVRAVKAAGEKENPETPHQDGAEQEGDRVEEPKEKGGASEEPVRVWSATPPTDAASFPAIPPTDAALLSATTPSCRRRGESSGGAHPPLLPEAITASMTPAAVVQPVTTTNQVATTYYTRTRTELQDLCRESRIQPEETLAVWLGRLVVELGSDLLNQEEASFLVRQASWSRGHVTDIDMVAVNVHWPIPLPVLVAGLVGQKAHVWHDGRPEHTGAEHLMLGIIGVSYCVWNPRACALGLTSLQRIRPWPHHHL